jgi:hypothetical protein
MSGLSTPTSLASALAADNVPHAVHMFTHARTAWA